mmetsp:Transcript_24375/g.61940  ORF Transcript_24375/g.61940 Transcript_24375/m.61940 type:complete len:295 (-) Transcript_24375:180-1064(-)
MPAGCEAIAASTARACDALAICSTASTASRTAFCCSAAALRSASCAALFASASCSRSRLISALSALVDSASASSCSAIVRRASARSCMRSVPSCSSSSIRSSCLTRSTACATAFSSWTAARSHVVLTASVRFFACCASSTRLTSPFNAWYAASRSAFSFSLVPERAAFSSAYCASASSTALVFSRFAVSQILLIASSASARSRASCSCSASFSSASYWSRANLTDVLAAVATACSCIFFALAHVASTAFLTSSRSVSAFASLSMDSGVGTMPRSPTFPSHSSRSAARAEVVCPL